MWLLAFASFLLALGQTVPSNNNTMLTRACIPPHHNYDFCNIRLSVDRRVRNLISLLRSDEKPLLLTARNGGGGSPGPGSNISRLGLPEYDWGVNCIHGVQTSCVKHNGRTLCPTSFPNPVNFGMTFNDSLSYDMGAIISTELRALWLLGAVEYSQWSGRGHAGLDCWSPNINIQRDPRWGRNQETPSEDPFVNGQFGTYYTKGLQEGEDPKYIKVVVTLKHWDAYSLEKSDGFTRHNFNAIVSNATLADTFFPAFKASITEGKAHGVMCSYNALNGIPTCANPMLTGKLNEWGYDGYVTSDTGAIDDIFQHHKYTKTGAQAACKAIVDGRCDINSGAVYHDSLMEGVKKGYCHEPDVDKALYNSLKLRFQLGLFDPIQNQPYWHVPPDSINTPAAQDLNLLATLSSMVLLENNDKTLPFESGSRVVVIGPHGKAQAALVGNYLGQLCPEDGYGCIQTPLAAIARYNQGGVTLFEQGCPLEKNDTSGFTAAIKAARDADYVVLMMGIDQSIEAEDLDRVTIDLPYIQTKLIQEIALLKKQTVLVLLNGGMLAIAPQKAILPAILEAGYPGMLGSEAIARTIFGQNDHLGGKLPYTVYPSDYISQVKMSYMEMEPSDRVSPGRTYRYYTGPVTYPFGYGISLTTFKIEKLSSPAFMSTTEANSAAPFKVKVTNDGTRTGDEVIMAYMVPPKALNSPLIKQLVGYKRVHLKPGQSEVVEIDVPAKALSLVERETANRVLVPGKYEIQLSNGLDTISCQFVLGGPKVVLEYF